MLSSCSFLIMYFDYSPKEIIILKTHLRFSVSIFQFFLCLFRTDPEQKTKNKKNKKNPQRTKNCGVDLFSFPPSFLSHIWHYLSTGARACPWSCFSSSGDRFTLIHPHSLAQSLVDTILPSLDTRSTSVFWFCLGAE